MFPVCLCAALWVLCHGRAVGVCVCVCVAQLRSWLGCGGEVLRLGLVGSAQLCLWFILRLIWKLKTINAMPVRGFILHAIYCFVLAIMFVFVVAVVIRSMSHILHLFFPSPPAPPFTLSLALTLPILLLYPPLLFLFAVFLLSFLLLIVLIFPYFIDFLFSYCNSSHFKCHHSSSPSSLWFRLSLLSWLLRLGFSFLFVEELTIINNTNTTAVIHIDSLNY